MHVNDISFFPDLNVDKTVFNLNNYGYSMGINLSDKYADALAICYEDTHVRAHIDTHKSNQLIFDIAHNAKIFEVARKCIGVEPIFYTSIVAWSLPHNPNEKIDSPLPHQQFHYDVGDFKSLNLFFYLTDTEEDCGPHVVIENTHKSKSPLQFINHRLTDNEAHIKYGDQIKVITGKKGTGFFEDCMSFHKQLMGKKPRLMLTLVYTMRRKFSYYAARPKGVGKSP